jgi:hypothetical protein
MSKKPELPAELKKLVAKVGPAVSPSEVDSYGRIRNIIDESHRIRTIVNAWKLQQTQERGLREKYAFTLIVSFIVQAALINVVFLLVGMEWIKYDPGVAKAFILAVFGELSAMVFFIVKYLFRPGSDKVLELTTSQKPARRKVSRGKKSGD